MFKRVAHLVQRPFQMVVRRLGPRLRTLVSGLRAAQRVARQVRSVLPRLARKGIVLKCHQFAPDQLLSVRLDGTMALTGTVLTRFRSCSVAVFAGQRCLGEAILTPYQPGLQRWPSWLARFYPHFLTRHCLRMDCRVDMQKAPFEATALRIEAHGGGRCQVCITVDLFALATPDYALWRKEVKPQVAGLLWMQHNSAQLPFQPTVSLVMRLDADTPMVNVRSTLRSLARQAYPHWQLWLLCQPWAHAQLKRELPALPQSDRLHLVLAPDADAVTAGSLASSVQGEMIGFIDAGDILEPEALFELLYELNRHADADVIYADEDVIAEDFQRQHPVFKPDWSPELLLGMNYIGRPWLARQKLWEAVADTPAWVGAAGEYDLLLRLTEKARKVVHARAVLYGRRGAAGGDEKQTDDASRTALQNALVRRGIEGRVLPGRVPGTFRVQRQVSGSSLVSVILILNQKMPARLLKVLAGKTTYPSWELLILDRTGASTKLFSAASPGAPRVLPCAATQGYGQLCNQGVAAARGDYLVFLEDPETVTPGWIEALLDHAQSEQVGAVGGRIVDRRGQIQHGGFILQDRLPGSHHAFYGQSLHDCGTYKLAAVAHTCSAVSASCMMVRRDQFLQMGGFDEQMHGQQADVDFCLRLRELGYRTVTTPHAVVSVANHLRRHDSVLEVDSPSYWARWKTLHAVGDPYYHPGLCSVQGDYTLNRTSLTVVNYSPRPLIDPGQVRNILLVKLDHLGDMIVALPVFQRVRQIFPQAQITALVSSLTRPLLQLEQVVDRILTFDYFAPDSALPPRPLTPLLRRELVELLQPHEFDLAIDLRWDTDTRFVLPLSGATYTAGYAEPGTLSWLTVAVMRAGIPRAVRAPLHITQVMLQLIDEVAVAAQVPQLSQHLGRGQVSAAQEELLASLLPSRRRPLIAIHAGAGNPLRRWPAECFARLADQLIERMQATVLFVGGPGDVAIAHAVIGQMRQGIHALSLAGQIGLDTLPAALRSCDLFIGSDSGPGHVAAAVGVPTLSLFAGTMHPQLWAPLGSTALNVRHHVPCAPCYHTSFEMCTGEWRCMRHLHVEAVWEAAVRALLPRSAALWTRAARRAA